MASEAVAQVVFLLAGGVLADRFSRYRLMVGSDLIAFAAQGSVAGLFISEAAPLGLIAALSAVTGAASGIFYPSSRGLIPQIVKARSCSPRTRSSACRRTQRPWPVPQYRE